MLIYDSSAVADGGGSSSVTTSPCMMMCVAQGDGSWGIHCMWGLGQTRLSNFSVLCLCRKIDWSGGGRNGCGSVSSSRCFALCIMVELGSKNEWVGFPFRSQERQAMWFCEFLWSIGTLVSVLLVAFLGAATKPLTYTVKEGKGLFWFGLMVSSITVKYRGRGLRQLLRYQEVERWMLSGAQLTSSLYTIHHSNLCGKPVPFTVGLFT